MINILLLGCGGNAGINFVKSLKKSKNIRYKIIGIDIDLYNLKSSNSDVKIFFNQKSNKLNFIKKVIKKYGIKFIHAQPDPEVKFLLENKKHFKDLIFNHDMNKYKIFADKLFCQSKWNKDFSHSFKCYNLFTLKNDKKLRDKFFYKGSKKWVRAIRGAGSKAALPVYSYLESKNWADYWIKKNKMKYIDFMVSDYLSGREFAVQTFWKNGELIHSQARQRLVYFFGSIMPSGQSSTPAVAKTINLKSVYKQAYRSITSIDNNPNGIYCVDLKENDLGEIITLEINYGRFFTTSDFFAEIGVNTPLTYVDCFFGSRISKKIEKIKNNFYWIRGIDKEPYLLKR